MRRLRDRIETFRYRAHRLARLVPMAVSGGVVPLFQGGGPEPTMTTTAAVTAGRLVEVSGDRSIRHAQGDSRKTIGVAKQTGSAVGDKVAIATSGVWYLTASGAINAGDLIVPAASNDGKVSAISGLDVTATPTETTIEAATVDVLSIVGIALAAISDGVTGPVLLKGLS